MWGYREALLPMPKMNTKQRKSRGTALGTMSRDSKFCAPGGIRTPNLLIRSQMLYPLSYGRSPLLSSAYALLCNENLLYPRT